MAAVMPHTQVKVRRNPPRLLSKSFSKVTKFFTLLVCWLQHCQNIFYVSFLKAEKILCFVFLPYYKHKTCLILKKIQVGDTLKRKNLNKCVEKHGEWCFHSGHKGSLNSLSVKVISESELYVMAFTPDLNLIEHLWEILVLCVRQRSPPPSTTANERIFVGRMLFIPSVQRLGESMLRTTEAALVTHGGPAAYWDTLICHPSLHEFIYNTSIIGLFEMLFLILTNKIKQLFCLHSAVTTSTKPDF